ncbi:hypothetical protein [Paraburkholderia sp. C35]|uniref:hypothetical protein n=1 Tax=Paraburkholderia sp. C35 TaxID=2126993 RepID=UPI000D699E0E|nr:hypothetical protein [Paraburkholderia sp. C35]
MEGTNNIVATSDQQDEIITAAEAARRMKLTSGAAVAHHVRRGHLPSVPNPRRRPKGFLLRASDVETFIEASAAADPSALMRCGDVAKRLGISRALVLRLVAAGRLRTAPRLPGRGRCGRPGPRFQDEQVAQFIASETTSPNTMTAEEVRRALDLEGDDQVLHLARTRGWQHLVLHDENGHAQVYVQKDDVEAFRKAGSNPLRHRYSLDQTAAIVGYSGSAEIYRMVRDHVLDGVRDGGRWWVAAADVHAHRDTVALRRARRPGGGA